MAARCRPAQRCLPHSPGGDNHATPIGGSYNCSISSDAAQPLHPSLTHLAAVAQQDECLDQGLAQGGVQHRVVLVQQGHHLLGEAGGLGGVAVADLHVEGGGWCASACPVGSQHSPVRSCVVSGCAALHGSREGRSRTARFRPRRAPPRPAHAGSSAHVRDEGDQLRKLVRVLAGLEQEQLQARLVVPPLQPKLVAVPRRVALDAALRAPRRGDELQRGWWGPQATAWSACGSARRWHRTWRASRSAAVFDMAADSGVLYMLTHGCRGWTG